MTGTGRRPPQSLASELLAAAWPSPAAASRGGRGQPVSMRGSRAVRSGTYASSCATPVVSTAGRRATSPRRSCRRSRAARTSCPSSGAGPPTASSSPGSPTEWATWWRHSRPPPTTSSASPSSPAPTAPLVLGRVARRTETAMHAVGTPRSPQAVPAPSTPMFWCADGARRDTRRLRPADAPAPLLGTG